MTYKAQRRPPKDPGHSPDGKMRTGEPVRGPAAGAAAGFLRRPPPGPAGPRRYSPRSLIIVPYPSAAPTWTHATYQKERCGRASPCEGPPPQPPRDFCAAPQPPPPPAPRDRTVNHPGA